MTLPDWPKLTDARVTQIVDKAVARAGVLVPRLIGTQVKGLLGTGATLLWRMLGSGKLRGYIELAIQQELILRDLHAGWTLGNDDERSVFAGLSDPAFDFRTVPGLARSTYLDRKMISAILDDPRHRRHIYKQPYSGTDGPVAYTLISRKPGWFTTNIGNPFSAPSYG
ncbi:MAG: hypothetical protein WDN25_00150 [Acetobacteraceae bacterium]